MMCHRIFLRRASAAVGRGRTCVGAATAPSPHGSDTAGPQPMSMYGKERNALGSILSDVLSDMPAAPRYFLDNGTLLGLWRNGALIDKDDDFDFGVLVNKSEFSKTWVGEFQDAVQQGLDQHHELHSGGEGGVGVARYQSRVVGSYADKIEVFDASMGSYPLAGEKYHGARYHHVSCDLQMHVMDDVVVEANAKIPDAEKERQGGGDGGGEEVGDAAALATATAAAAILIVEETVVTGKGVKIHHSDFATRGKAPGDVYEPFGHVTYVTALSHPLRGLINSRTLTCGSRWWHSLRPPIRKGRKGPLSILSLSLARSYSRPRPRPHSYSRPRPRPRSRSRALARRDCGLCQLHADNCCPTLMTSSHHIPSDTTERVGQSRSRPRPTCPTCTAIWD